MSSMLSWRIFCTPGITTQKLEPLTDPSMVAELQSSRCQMSEKSHLTGTEEVVPRALDSSRFIRVSI